MGFVGLKVDQEVLVDRQVARMMGSFGGVAEGRPRDREGSREIDLGVLQAVRNQRKRSSNRKMKMKNKTRTDEDQVGEGVHGNFRRKGTKKSRLYLFHSMLGPLKLA